MKKSRFNVVIEDYPEKDYNLIFNTLSKAFFITPRELYLDIEKDNGADSPIIDRLEASGIVLEDSVDEELLYQYWLGDLKANQTQLSMTLIMTTKCNCACVYCYEDWIREKKIDKVMTREDSIKIVEWMKKYIGLKGLLKLDICFHGGEPTLVIDEVEFIGCEMKKFGEDNNVKTLFSMVTNGTQLDSNTKEKMISAGITNVQVTVDGPKEVHNRRRPLTDGGGTFDTIFENLEEMPTGLLFDLNMNVDEDNSAHLNEYLDYLVENGYQKKTSLSISYTVSSRNIKIDKKKDNLVESIESIYDRMQDVGFLPSSLHDDYSLCTLSKRNCFAIDAKGDIFKCISGVEDDAFRIGNIKDDLNLLAINESRFQKDMRLQACHTCEYLPLCNNGCIFNSHIRGDINKKICSKKYYDIAIPRAMKRMYETSRK